MRAEDVIKFGQDHSTLGFLVVVCTFHWSYEWNEDTGGTTCEQHSVPRVGNIAVYIEISAYSIIKVYMLLHNC